MKITRLTTVFLALLAVTAISADEPTDTGDVNADNDRRIEPQPLNSALVEFAERTGLQIIYMADVARGVDTDGAEGDLSDEAMLDQLLASTNLRYEFLNDRTVTVQPAVDAGGASDSKNGPAQLISVAQATTSEKSSQATTSRRNRNETDPDGTQAEDDSSDEERIDEIKVTGSRIAGFSPSKPVITIGAEEIARAGYANLEDIFRALPASFTGYSEVDGFGDTGLFADSATELTTPQFGNVTILSLGALGPSATLVLVDGRRLATNAEAAGGFTDVSGIPVSMIERIEILPAGSAALYGSDAVAGVINIILKKDAQGGDITAEYRHSEHSAHYKQLSGSFTKGWDSGKVTLNGTYSDYAGVLFRDIWEGRPISALGDWREFGGSDFRSIGAAQPGLIFLDDPGFSGSRAVPDFIIPANQDGTNLQIADLIPFTGTLDDVPRLQLLPSRITSPTEKWAASLFFDQALSDNYQLFGSLLYSEQRVPRNTIDFYSTSNPVPVPSTNPWSPFNDSSSDPRTIYVRYTPLFEERNGAFFGTRNPEAKNIQENASIGIDGVLPFATSWDMTLQYSYGQHETCCTFDFVFGPTDRGIMEQNLTGFDADGNPFPDDLILNVFGDGTANGPAVFDAVDQSEQGDESSTSDVHHVSLETTGSVGSLPAGDVELALLVEATRNRIFSGAFPKPEGLTGETLSFSGQLVLPILGPDTAGGGHSLTADLAARYERTNSEGTVVKRILPFGGPNTTEEIQAKSTDNVFSPEIGLSYYPTEGLRFRATWSTAFMQPNFQQRFAGDRTVIVPGFLFGAFGVPPNATIVRTAGGNSELKEQESETYTFGVDLTPTAIDGLTVRLTWSRTEIDNYIAPVTSFANVFSLLQFPEAFPEFVSVTPDANGDPEIYIEGRYINFARRDLERVDFDIGYQFDAAIGSFDLGLQGAHVLESRFTLRPGDSKDLAGTNKGPNKLRGLGYVSWNRGNATITTVVNYDHGLQARVLQPNGAIRIPGFGDFAPELEVDVGSVVTVDLDLLYDFGSRFPNWLSGTAVRFGIKDLFDEDLEFLDNSLGYNNLSGNSEGRTYRLAITRRF